MELTLNMVSTSNIQNASFLEFFFRRNYLYNLGCLEEDQASYGKSVYIGHKYNGS